MRFTRPVTRQALRGGMVAVALSALVSGALNLPALAQGLDVVTDPDAPAFSAEDQAAVDALAAQLAGATSRNAVVSILQNSTLPKAQVRAALDAAITARRPAASSVTAYGDEAVGGGYEDVTLESLPALLQQIKASGDKVKLRAVEAVANQINALLDVRQNALRDLEQARKAGDTESVAQNQRKIEMANAMIANKLSEIPPIVGYSLQTSFRPTPPAADPVAETLKTVLDLISDSKIANDTRLTFVDTQNNSTAAITQPAVTEALAQGPTVTIYVG